MNQLFLFRWTVLTSRYRIPFLLQISQCSFWRKISQCYWFGVSSN